MKQTLSHPPATCAPAAFLSVCRRLRQGLFHDKAGAFLAVLCVRLLAARAALAPLVLAAALFAIPADEARAHDDTSATLHAEGYPLHEAAAVGDLNAAKHFITAHTIPANTKTHRVFRTTKTRTPTHIAAGCGRVSVLAYLISVGGAVNARSDYPYGGYTPLHDAANGSYAGCGVKRKTRAAALSVVLTLIAAGAEVNVIRESQIPQDLRPLHYAVAWRASLVVSALIVAGAHWGVSCENGNVVNPAGATPPCICESPKVRTAAGACESVAVCELPLSLNGRTNRCGCLAPYLNFGDGDCRPPSEEGCATYHNPPLFFDPTAGKCTKRLWPCHDSAKRKADNTGCDCPAGTFAHGDPSGGRWYQPCESYRYGRCSRRGEWRKTIPDTAECHADHAPITHDLDGWLAAIGANNPALVAHFIAEHMQDPDGDDALHTAAQGGHHQAAKALIEGGADIGRTNADGDAPLHLAVRNGRAPLITLLLQRGADADATGEDGDTPLHLAARKTDTAENAGLISFLLDKGADPNPRNSVGWRPLDLSFHGGNAATWQARRGIMAALIAGGADWSNECAGGAIPNRLYNGAAEVATYPRCACPRHISQRDSFGACECPAHSHAQVNGRCLPKDSAQVEAEILKMETALLSLRAALVSLNARLTAAAEMPREMVEEIAEQAEETAKQIERRRDNFLALARADLAGEPAPPVAMSDTEAECRMLGGEVQIHSATGIRVCSGIDKNGTFCLVDSSDAYPCRGLFRHIRRCNDDYNRPALNPFFCGPKCGEREAVGNDCE